MSNLIKIILCLSILITTHALSFSQDTPFPGLSLGNLGCPATPSVSGNTSGAATDCGVSSAGDHIYQFNLTTNADIIIDVCGASWDTQIHLFSLANGNCNAGAIASNDDACGLQSRITQSCLPAGNYVVVVEGFGTSTGAYTLNFTTSNCACFIPAAPANDLCANATTLNCGVNLIGETTVSSTNVAHGTGCTMNNYGVWYTFVGDGNISNLTADPDAGFNIEMAVTSGSCGSLTNVSCIDNNTAGVAETYSFLTTLGVNYFVYIGAYGATNHPNANSGFDISRTCTVPPPAPSNDLCGNATPLACGTTLNGQTSAGASNIAHGTGCAMGDYGVWYSFTGDGNNSTITSTADAGWNHEIAIASGACGSLTNVSCTDNVGAGGTETVTFTTTNGINYFVYIGCDFAGSVSGCSSGFDISRTCAVPPPPTQQDCAGGTSICNDSTFVGNSSGAGTINDLNASNDGCLSGENQTSWYFFEAQTSGTLEFLISPQNGTDDYDFAMWGPYPSGSTPASICPPASAPVRCSYAAGAPLVYGGTGLQIGAGDQTEGAGGDDIVDELFLNVGDVYILVIDNFSASGSPFDIDFTLTNGLDLNCSQLPVDLLSFNGLPFNGYNKLEWMTAAEINNDHFDVEKSSDGIMFKKIGTVKGAGNNSGLLHYEIIDDNPNPGISYYRLKQVDFNGAFEYSNTVAIKQSRGAEVAIFPNPTAGKLKLNFVSKEAGNYEVIVSDISKVIYQNNIFIDKGNHIINFNYFEDLAQGFYFVKIIDENGNIIKIDKVIRK